MRKLVNNTSATRTSLLATTGLAALMVGTLMAHPARAAMTVTTGGSVTVTANTVTTATTNTNGATASSLDRIQLWNNGTSINASVTGGTITGNGLALEEAGGAAASITVSGTKAITSTATGGIGLLLQGNGGAIFSTDTSTVSGPTGLEATNLLSGAITLTTSSSVTGTANAGILTTAVDGATLITINGGTTKGFTGFAGINSSATGAGNLGVVITAGTVGSTTSTAIMLNQTGSGSNTITNSGTITGAGTAANPAIMIATATGSTTITNNVGGKIQAPNATSPSGLAILSTVTTGVDHIVNAGTLTGDIYLSNQTNTLTNSGTWAVQDNSGTGYNAAAFGTSGHNGLTNSTGGIINAGSGATTSATFSGVDTVTNAGTINVNGAASFQGDASFNNAGGLIDMRTAGDATTDVTALNIAVSGNTYTPASAVYNFAGGINSELGLDALVGAVSSTGANVPADRLLISGTATGATGILLNDLGGSTGGSYNPVGITLVAVNGASTNAFYLQDVTEDGSSDDLLQTDRGPMGAIKKGFWFYPLLQTTNAVAVADGLTGADSSEYRLYGLPDVEAFQTTYAVTGAEDIWYDTTLGWNQRQADLRKYWPGVYGTADTYADGKFNFWVKATGNWDSRTSSNSLASYSPVSGMFANFDTSFNQNTYSVQAGSDVGFNHVLGGDGVLVLGMSAGVIDSMLKFGTSPNEFDYSGVTIAGTVDYLQGGFFWDTTLAGDFLQATLNYNSLAYFGDNRQTVNAPTWGVLSSAGVHVALNHHGVLNDTFLEPRLTIAYTSSILTDFTALGTNAGFNASNTVRGAAGAKFGGRLVDRDGMIVDVSITGDYWNEFTNKTSVTFSTAAPSPALTFSDPRQKGYGEVTGQMDIADKGSGLSGFVAGGAKLNSEFTSVQLSGGITYKW